MSEPNYDCDKCPGYCCSYDEIALTSKDISRLATHLGLDDEAFITRHTKYGTFNGPAREPMMMKHQPDRHFRTICTFFDTDTRRCTVYDARPDACRDYPHEPRCGYYDFLTFERKLQGKEDHVAVTR